MSPDIDKDVIRESFAQYPVDKILGVYRGSYNASSINFAGYAHQESFAHGLDEAPLTKGLYSLDGVTYYDQASYRDFSGSFTNTALQYSDSTNIHIISETSGVTTLYYIIIAFSKS